MSMRRSFLACLFLVGASALAQAEQGNPKIKLIEAINFGPNGLLLIGGGSQVVTVETGDVKPGETTKGIDIANVDQLIAAKLGLSPKDIEIRRLAVNPASQTAYIAVRSLKTKQDVILTINGAGQVKEVPLDNVTFNRYPLSVADKAVTKITDITWAGNRIVVATQAADTFGSRVFSIMPGNKEISPVSFGTETYHVGHGRWETKAPIVCIMPYEDNGKASVVGSFTCTPIVKYPLEDIKPNAHVKGISVVELGTGNTPRSMFSYEKDGKKFILINAARNNKQTAFGTSAYWVARVDYDLLGETSNINEKALWRVKGKKFEPATDRVMIAPEYYGVHQMAKLDGGRALIIRDDKGGGFRLLTVALP